ncbi:hypothetical protein ACFX15_029416 [Malus domestica]
MSLERKEMESRVVKRWVPAMMVMHAEHCLDGELRQNPNQLGNVVVEDVPEEIPNNNRLTILGGVKGNNSLSTDELHGGTREQVGDVIHLTLNF